jgi:hypothetical protein
MQARSSQHSRRGRFAGFGLLVGLLTFGSLWPTLASAQHTSAECPPQTGTVTSGGTVTINITDCASNIAFAGIGVIDGGSSGAADVEDHGTATTRITDGQWFLDYSHNGTTGVGSTDVFEITEATATGNGDVQVTITINPSASPITVLPASLPTLTAGTPFSQTLTSFGGLAPYTYTLQSGVLPIGVTLSSGGVLSGTPTQRGAYSFSVRSTDATAPTGQFVDRGYTGSVQNPILAISPATGTAIQGVPFSQSLVITGGVAPHICQLETGTLPVGISVSSACVISGTTAAAPGSFPVTIRVTDASTGPGTYFEVESYTFTVSPPPSVDIAVSPVSVSEDGATNLTYVVTRSLSIASLTTVNITISGTATSGTDYTGGVATVVIPAGATTATFTVDPTVDGTVEADETVTMTVAAGTGYTVGVPASATGTILNDDVPSATISVSPADVAEDGAPNLIYTVTLNQASFSALNVGYTIGGTASNGTDYATIAAPLAIPAGNTTGTITVNPTADATIETNETVTLTLNAGAGYTVGVPNAATGTILNDDLPNLVIDDVTANEGDAGTTNFTFTVSLSAPSGPGGVTFDIATANGTATAGSDYVANTFTAQTIPAGSSTYTFTVQANGDALNEPSETFFVNVTNVVNAVVVDIQGVGTIVNDDPLPSLSINDVTVVEGNSGTTNAVFTVTLSAASGQSVTVNHATADGTATQPSDYTNTSGTSTFTPGQTTQTVTVPVVGEIVPEANETFFVNLSGATNATIADNQGVGTITNDDVPITVSPATLPGGAVTAAYSQTLTASGGVGPYTFAVTAGALPAGLTLSPGGVLSGTPTAGGSFNVTVTATDTSPAPGPFTGSQAYTLAVAVPTITLPPTTLAGGTTGTAYNATLNPAAGGTAPYTYAVIAGALPGGLALNPTTRVISGTPTAAGTFNFSVTATDSSTGTGPYTATQSYAITVVAIVLDPATLPGATAATPYSQTITASNGTAPYGFTVTAGALPAGLALSTGGTLSGTPTAAGTFNFTITATDAASNSGSRAYTLAVGAPTVSIAPASLPGGSAGTAYSQALTASGGNAPYAFTVSAGALPAGLTLSGAGLLSGTPTVAGTFNVTVTATDSTTGTAGTASRAYTLVLTPPNIVVNQQTLPTTFIGQPYSVTLTSSGGTAPYTYVVTAGTLPPGLTLTSAGVLSGTPTAFGTFTFTVTSTDALGFTGTRVYTLIGVSGSIPANSPWGLALMALLLALLGGAALRRRRDAMG